MLSEEIFRRFWGREKKESLFLFGMMMTAVGFAVGWALFPGKLLPIVFFVTMSLVPFVNKIFHKKPRKQDIVTVYFFLFLGMIAVFVFLQMFFFTERIVYFGSYESIKLQDPYFAFSEIIMNNVKLVFICLLLSMLYGIGSMFILTLNAAVIGQLFSGFISQQKFGLFTAFLPHTIAEFFSYFMAAIAGGYLALAFVKKHRKKDFESMVMDSSIIFSVSIILIILAAFMESFVLPALL